MNRLAEISIPQAHKQEIVRRILAYKFKPSTNRRTILLAKKGITDACLPSIPNIEFCLLSDAELEAGGVDVYFFTRTKS